MRSPLRSPLSSLSGWLHVSFLSASTTESQVAQLCVANGTAPPSAARMLERSADDAALHTRTALVEFSDVEHAAEAMRILHQRVKHEPVRQRQDTRAKTRLHREGSRCR